MDPQKTYGGMMEKAVIPTVGRRKPITESDIRGIAENARGSSFYVLPGLLREKIQKEEPKPVARKNVSPYVLPGLEK